MEEADGVPLSFKLTRKRAEALSSSRLRCGALHEVGAVTLSGLFAELKVKGVT